MQTIPSTLQESKPDTNFNPAKRKGPTTLKAQLKLLGADQYDLRVPETHYLPQLMRPDETLLGVIYGHYTYLSNHIVGRGLFAATNKRLLFIDKKPLYLNYDECVYDMVGGIAYSHAGFATTITVNTRMGDISFRTFNRKTARHFVQAVERMLFKSGAFTSELKQL